jgi:hypothetical protein
MQGTLVAKFQEMKRLPEDTDNLFKINRFLAASFPNQSHNNFTKFAHEEERCPERVRGTWECLQVAWPRQPRRLARAFAGPLSVLHDSGPSSTVAACPPWRGPFSTAARPVHHGGACVALATRSPCKIYVKHLVGIYIKEYIWTNKDTNLWGLNRERSEIKKKGGKLPWLVFLVRVYSGTPQLCVLAAQEEKCECGGDTDSATGRRRGRAEEGGARKEYL